MAEKGHTQFDEKTLKQLHFVRWLDLQSGRPDRHGVQTPLPEFAKKVRQEEPVRRSSFIPDNTTGV